ncbi:MAG: hypothetical protein M0P74_18015 [Syntrophales bacterium]|jgi:diadenosine tetraphosphate (Ap4A) HIT family hydrolase|nr:hypothetical protein [Syntrophales bacterium]
MTNCRLCSDLLYQGSAKSWNEPLFESPNFVALPSLGALVEGWLLLVPKKHFICMGALPDSVATEMQEVKHFLCSVLQQYYGQVAAFEHGPSRPNCSVGCSVDHAHLHLVPVAFDLSSAAAPFLPKDVHWSAAGLKECRTAFGQGEDYLYFEQPIGAGRIARHKDFESQIFRRAIAMQTGAFNQFNWREYPQLPNVSATINKLRTKNGNVFLCKNRLEIAA